MFLFIGVFPRERELAVVRFLCEYCRTPAEQRVVAGVTGDSVDSPAVGGGGEDRTEVRVLRELDQ